MPRRTAKSIFVEIVSFLTLFALVGIMTSNFWERYLIQTELSNMKSSLHVLKETVYNIGAAYDTLYQELNGLDRKAAKSLPHQYDETLNNLVRHTLMNMKTEGINNNQPYLMPPNSFKSALKNATTIKYSPKSTGIDMNAKQINYVTDNNQKQRYPGRNIHKCCMKDDCRKYDNIYRKF